MFYLDKMSAIHQATYISPAMPTLTCCLSVAHLHRLYLAARHTIVCLDNLNAKSLGGLQPLGFLRLCYGYFIMKFLHEKPLNFNYCKIAKIIPDYFNYQLFKNIQA